MNRKFFNFVKIILSVIITGISFYYVYKSVNFQIFLKSFYKIDIKFYIVALLLVILGVFLQAYRLHNYLGLKKELYFFVLKITFISYLFNNFFISFFGGDTYRVYKMNKICGIKDSIKSIFWVRLTNLFAMFLFLIIFFWYPKNIDKFFIAIFLKFSSLIAWIFFIFLIIFSLINQKLKKYIFLILTGIIFQLIVIFNHYYIMLALHLKLNLLDITVVIPSILLITALPISFNGIGIREAAFIYGLKLFKINANDALLFSVLSYSFGIFNSIIGGLIYIFETKLGLKNDHS